MSRSPYGRNDACDALNGCVCKSGQDVGEVIADRDLEPSTTFHNREDGGYARPSLFAADVDPVGAANCDRAHGILSEVGAQLQLWSERAPEWIQPGGINRLATCLTRAWEIFSHTHGGGLLGPYAERSRDGAAYFRG